MLSILTLEGSFSGLVFVTLKSVSINEYRKMEIGSVIITGNQYVKGKDLLNMV